jgi:cytochrome P450
VRQWVRHFVDRFAATGQCDLISDLVVPLPASVTMELLGFPEEEWLPFASVFHDISSYTHGHPKREAAFKRYGEIMGAISREVADRRANPGDDMISAMMQSRHDGVAVDDTMLRHLVFMVMAGGVDTTTALAAAAFVHLGSDHALRERLQREPELLTNATEEFLRMYPPSRTHARTVARDVEFAGCCMAAGDRIVMSELSANYDERAFENPHGFNPDRFPNRHVTFGMGIHRCPGSHIARVMFTEMVSAILERASDYTIVKNGLIEYPSWTMVGGWASIPIRFTPAKA